MACATHIADPSFQIGAGATGGVDCTAHSASNAIDHATCGAKDPGGRTIRLKSSEPIPDPNSPGLNLSQVATVAKNDYGVSLDIRIGSRKVPWAEYERRRMSGQGAIIQVNYGPIADSKYDAGRGFRGGHAMFESVHATYDPLADGRASGVFRHNGSVYDRELIKKAAGGLIIASSSQGVVRVGQGYIWAAFTRDVIPAYHARVPAGEFWAYWIVDEQVKQRSRRSTGGFSAGCTPPITFKWPGHGTATLVKLLTGSRAGKYISANWADEGAGMAEPIDDPNDGPEGPPDTDPPDDDPELDQDVKNDPVPTFPDDPQPRRARRRGADQGRRNARDWARPVRLLPGRPCTMSQCLGMTEVSPPTSPAPGEALLHGRDAVTRHAWPEAFEQLSQADRDGQLSGADLEGLALAAFFAAQGDVESPSRSARSRPTKRRATSSAPPTSPSMSPASTATRASLRSPPPGLRRAERIIGTDGETYAHGYLALLRSEAAAWTGDAEAALALAERAVEIGTRAADADLKAHAQTNLGALKIASGRHVRRLRA